MKGKRFIAVWISSMVIIQVIGNCLLKKGIVIPKIVECICVLIHVLPVIVFLFYGMKNNKLKVFYRFLAGSYFVIACVALIITVFMMFA